jgi:hypothetical protein
LHVCSDELQEARVKHIRAQLASTCAHCRQDVLRGTLVVLMRGSFKGSDVPEEHRGRWIHKACYKTLLVSRNK